MSAVPPTSRPLSPENTHLFDLLIKVVREQAGQPYTRANAETKAPAFKDYQQITQADDGTLRYETRGGEKVEVDKSETPGLFEQVDADKRSLDGIQASKDAGYRRATDNEVWPGYNGTNVGAPEEMGPALIRYDRDGEKVVVHRDDNPELYDYLTRLQALGADVQAKTDVDGAQKEGSVLAGRDQQLPAFDDYQQFLWTGELGSSGVITYETRDGETITVSQDVTPELYAQVLGAAQTRVKINESVDQGWQEAGADLNVPDKDITTFGWPEELGDGLIRFQTKDDGGYIVSDKTNPELYAQIVAKRAAHQTEDVDAVRAEHDLPPLDELDVLSQETEQLADPKDENSQRLTVSEAATKNLIDGYKKRIEAGELAKDSDEAKLVMALEAKVAMQNGRGITGYQETQGLFGGTWRESDDKQTQLTGEDHQDIIDGRAVDEMLSTLFQTERISKDYSASLKSAIDSLPGRDELEQNLEDTLNSDAYLDYLKDLNEQGLSSAAQRDVGAMLQSLSLLDEEKGKQASQRLMQDGITIELNELVGDPSKIDPANLELATKDLFGLLKAVLKYDTFDIPRRTQETIEKFINEFMGDKKKLGEVTKVIQELNLKIQNGEAVTKADIDKAMVSTYTELGHEDAGKMANALDSLNKHGILGSLGGATSVVGAFYQLFAKNGQLADQPLERLAIAKDFISFLGASQHFIKTGDKIIGSGVADWMGLSKSVPAIWGSDGLWGKAVEEKRPPVPPQLGELDTFELDDFRSSMTAAIDDVFGRQPEVEVPKGVDNSIYDGIADMFERESGAGLTVEAPKLPPSTISRIAGTVVKTLGAAADTFSGVADIVLGAFQIKSGIANDSDLEKAAGSLQVIGGTLSGVAGGIGFASLFGSVGAASAFTGPLFLVGVAILGVVGIIGYFIDHEKKQKATDKEGQWYKDLADLGLLQGDWGDKVEYARYSINEYGEREAPADQSLYDYQAEEWNYFHETDQKKGSSSNRLNDELHVDYTA